MLINSKDFATKDTGMDSTRLLKYFYKYENEIIGIFIPGNTSKEDLNHLSSYFESLNYKYKFYFENKTIYSLSKPIFDNKNIIENFEDFCNISNLFYILNIDSYKYFLNMLDQNSIMYKKINCFEYFFININKTEKSIFIKDTSYKSSKIPKF